MYETPIDCPENIRFCCGCGKQINIVGDSHRRILGGQNADRYYCMSCPLPVISEENCQCEPKT